MAVALRTFASTSKIGWSKLFIQQTVKMSTENFRIERDTFGELKFFFKFLIIIFIKYLGYPMIVIMVRRLLGNFI